MIWRQFDFSRAEVGQGSGGGGSNLSLAGIRQVVVFPVRRLSNLLGHARGHKLVLRVDHEKLHALGVDFLRHIEHLFLKVLGRRFGSILLDRIRVLQALGERDVRPAVGDADDHDPADVAARHGVDAHPGCLREPVAQWGAAAARQLVEPPLGHGDTLRGRQEDLRLLSVERDDGHLVPRLVRLREKLHGRPFCTRHPVQGH
mmetsp:Transcript_13694/g.35354  ORF Transcript_13694/g.35354 Transcript_13694/m.35354 type:complete len:202 (+) Transcript_13694:200-805(+)